MKIIKKKKTSAIKRDPAKEQIFTCLASLLNKQGFEIRREKLKQGLGWKVISGQCRYLANDLIFVDNRLSQDDQIQFLTSKLASLKADFDNTDLETLPKSLRQIIRCRNAALPERKPLERSLPGCMVDAG